MFRGRIEPPYREVPLDEPVAANFFEEDIGLGGSQLSSMVGTYSHKPLDETHICLIDEQYGKIGRKTKEIAASVGAVFDPSNYRLLTTGVLISEELFLTSGHYSINGGKWLKKVDVSFNYECSINRIGGITLPALSTCSAILIAVSNNPDVDFALFRISLKRAQKIATIGFERDSDMLIVGHRGENPKKASYVYAPHSPYGDELVLSYAGKTGGGISGAPLFTTEGELYAIHSYTHQVKNSIPLKRILLYLAEYFPDFKAEIDIHQPAAKMLTFNSLGSNYANPVVLTYDTYQSSYQMPFLGFQREVFGKEDVKDLTPQAAARLPKKAKNLYNETKRHEQLERHNFIQGLRGNINSQDPFTDKFQKDHTYHEAESISKKDQAQYIAGIRGYGQATGTKSSSVVDMSREDATAELDRVIDDLDIDDLTSDEEEGFQIKHGTIFTTEKEYPIRSAPVMFSGNGKRVVGEMDRVESSFDFAPKIVDGRFSMHHFDGM